MRGGELISYQKGGGVGGHIKLHLILHQVPVGGREGGREGAGRYGGKGELIYFIRREQKQKITSGTVYCAVFCPTSPNV